jgi:hypothetical protein
VRPDTHTCTRLTEKRIKINPENGHPRISGMSTSAHTRIGRRLAPAVILATALLIAACGSTGAHTSMHSMSMAHSASKTHLTAASAAVVKSGHAAVAISNYAFRPRGSR